MIENKIERFYNLPFGHSDTCQNKVYMDNCEKEGIIPILS